jgi:hypothetical protein
MMMLMTGGKERTVEEYRHLLDQAGFHFNQLISTTPDLNIIDRQHSGFSDLVRQRLYRQTRSCPLNGIVSGLSAAGTWTNCRLFVEVTLDGIEEPKVTWRATKLPSWFHAKSSARPNSISLAHFK